MSLHLIEEQYISGLAYAPVLELEESDAGPAVSLADRAIGLKTVVKLMNVANNDRGFSEVVMPKEGFSPDSKKAATTAGVNANEGLLAARRVFAQACGYTALAEAGLMAEQDVQDMVTIDWYFFKQKYMGPQNAAHRQQLMQELAGAEGAEIDTAA